MNGYDPLRNRLWRDPVAAFTIHEAYLPDGGRELYYQPIIVVREHESEQVRIPLEEGEEVVGTVPAPAGTFAVYGMLPDECWHFLGYEYVGAENLDWDQELVAKKLTYERGELPEDE
jgi:hypothetical protein